MPTKHQFLAELLLRTDMKDVVREIDAGLSKAIRGAAKESRKVVADAWRDAVGHALTQGQTGGAIKSLLSSGVIEAAEKYQMLMKEGRKEEAKEQKKLLDERAAMMKRELGLQKQAAKEQRAAAGQWAENLEQGASSLRGMFQGGDFVGGILRELKGAGARRKRLGEEKISKAEDMFRAGADPKQVKQMAEMGRSLAKVGAALGTVAAAVGAIVLLVKLFADLEAKIKDMNKALLESAGAADFGMSAAEIRAGGLRRELERLRDDTTGLNENFRKFRAGAKEQQRILATLNQAGMTYARMNEEIKKGSKFMKDYSDVTALAVVYSRNLGVESGQIAQTMGEFAFETGMSLEQVAESFSIIQREAMNAGFVTKRFYAAIVESTSGMAFYGVRIEETTKLLKTFDSLLGEASGTEVFKKIAREGGKSFQDTLQEFLIKDPKFVAEQYGKVFEQRIAMLERQFAGELPQGVTVRGLIEETGGGVALAERLEELGITGQRGTDIMQAAELMKAATGEMTAMMGARGAAGPAFEAVMKLRQMPGLGAGESLGEIYETAVKEGNEGLLIALQNLAKSQGKDFDELKVLDQKNLARLQLLQRIAKEGGEVPEHLQKLGYFIERLPDGTGKVMQGIVDDTGVINRATARELGDRWDMLLTEPTEDAKRLEKQMTRDQQLASEISRNITGLNDMMEQTVVAVLNDIYDVLISIADFLFKDDPERQAELHFQEKMAEESKKATEHLQNLTDEQDKLVAKQERGEELSKEEQRRMEMLPDEIGRALDEAEFARDAAEMAKSVEGAQIREEGLLEVRRQLRESAGDQVAASEEMKAAVQQTHKIAQQVSGVGPEAQMPGWMQKVQDVTTMMTPGSGMGALTERAMTGLGMTEWTSRQGAKLGRALGVDAYEGMSDEEIDAIARAKQKGAEEVYAERSLLADVFGVGTVSSRVSRQEAGGREVEDALYQQTETERAQAAQAQEAMKQGFEELKGAIETSSMVNLLGGFLKPKKAGDLILPAEGGAPIITDDRDTLFAARPGGPLAGAMGSKGSVQVNVYGGDQRKVYDTVMRALKATGNA